MHVELTCGWTGGKEGEWEERKSNHKKWVEKEGKEFGTASASAFAPIGPQSFEIDLKLNTADGDLPQTKNSREMEKVKETYL